MKTRFWIALLAVILLLSALTGYWLLSPAEAAERAEIISNGQVLRTVDLRIDQSFTVTLEDGGFNTVTVSGGKIAVTDASCPDHYCALRGWCSGGTDIVCLPNRLVIRFLGAQEIDAISG